MSILSRGNIRLSPEYALLGFLYRSPGYGYELHQRLQDEFGNIWHASQSQTYSILKRLEAQGILESRLIKPGEHPVRRQLNITPIGRDRFEAWLNQTTRPSVHAIRVEFITRLYFTRRYFPERVGEMISAQVGVVKASLVELSSQLVEIPEQQTMKRLALELRVDLLTSVTGWLSRCLEVSSVGGSGED